MKRVKGRKVICPKHIHGIQIHPHICSNCPRVEQSANGRRLPRTRVRDEPTSLAHTSACKRNPPSTIPDLRPICSMQWDRACTLKHPRTTFSQCPLICASFQTSALRTGFPHILTYSPLLVHRVLSGNLSMPAVLWRMACPCKVFGNSFNIRKIPSKLPRAWKRMRNIKLLGTER